MEFFRDIAVIIIGAFGMGLGCWGLGRYLRSRGYGDFLDKVDGHINRFRSSFYEKINPVAKKNLKSKRYKNRK